MQSGQKADTRNIGLQQNSLALESRDISVANPMLNNGASTDAPTLSGEIAVTRLERTMALAKGAKFGAYEVSGALGAGGMGEVYRARDPRLKRDVAIKIVPAVFASDPQRLRRFEQEAHAVAALNHPNILAVYDIGSENGTPYIVSELLEGESLRERLRSGPLPLRKAVDNALQLVRGLAAAHDKGIVHRDLKPENIFITDDGRLKILDFGLAKLTRADATENDETPTCTINSEAGAVLGTVGYMSPEQVRGKAADARSDLFSFGAILYEMLAGKRAFHGESTAEAMAAIVNDEPPDLTETNRAVSPALDRIVRHCLEKNPAERFQSARDVAFNLESVSTASATGKVQPISSGRRWRVIATVGITAVVVFALSMIAARALWGRTKQPEFNRLTFRRGSVRMARFAPDGQTIVYGAAWDGNPVEPYMTRYNSSDSRPLGVPHAQVLSVSRTGEVALLLNTVNNSFLQVGTLARMALTGGAPRELLDMVQFADFSPDGTSMAVVRLHAPVLANAVSTGTSSIEYPVGTTIYQGRASISSLRISPDNQLLAFAEHVPGGDNGRVVITDRSGNKNYESQMFDSLRGFAWRRDGKELWFTAAPTGAARALYGVDLHGRQRLILRVPGTLTLQDIDENGRVLLTSENARQQMYVLPPGASKERDISWLEWLNVFAISPDGKTVLFDETGEALSANGIYVGGVDGSPAIRLCDGTWADVSADGKWVIADDTSEPAQLVLWPVGAGASRRITNDRFEHDYVRFLPDGKEVVFTGREPGAQLRSYLQSLEGGVPTPITPDGIAGSLALPISPDGRYLVAPSATPGSYAMYPVHGGPTKAINGLRTDDYVDKWSADGKYLIVHQRTAVPSNVFRVEIATGKRELLKQITPPDPAGVESVLQYYLSNDEKSYVYVCRTVLSDLYVVNGLK